MPRPPLEYFVEQYQLKATFVYDRLDKWGYFTRFDEVLCLSENAGSSLDWSEREGLGVNQVAWETVDQKDINPLLVFAHPNTLRLNPSLLSYYRCVSMLSQKGLQTIAGISSIKKIEQGDNIAIPEVKLFQVVRAINKTMCGVIALSSDFSIEQLRGMMYATAGSTIDGSWRNAIGTEGERAVKGILLQSLYSNQEITSCCFKNGGVINTDDISVGEVDLNALTGITVVNGSAFTFASEPDITISSASGQVLGGVEVKAGLDPAGALERLGAMFKSFDNIRGLYPNATTIFVASCITDEVAARLRESTSVSLNFLLTSVLSDDITQRRFLNRLRQIAGLVAQGL